MPIEKIKSGISDAVSSASHSLKNSLSFLSDLKEAGWEKVNTFTNDILGLAPLIEVTGFSMKEVGMKKEKQTDGLLLVQERNKIY